MNKRKDKTMSMTRCTSCEEIYDTDFQLNIDEQGDCICDNCWEEKATECDCCGEEQVCRVVFVNGLETNACYECSNDKG